MSAHDERFMSAAIAYARRGLGVTAPNPAVGSVLVKDGVIIGRGATQPVADGQGNAIPFG